MESRRLRPTSAGKIWTRTAFPGAPPAPPEKKKKKRRRYDGQVSEEEALHEVASIKNTKRLPERWYFDKRSTQRKGLPEGPTFFGQQLSGIGIIQLTTSSPKLAGKPVSLSTTKVTPSGGLLIRSRTSLATLERIRGGRFSIELLLPPPLEPLLYWR